ncbi:hypothetical protein [Pleionea sp. CnH1-48]|uniref:hypothetical protein n=1 Tax=Pleionea sp. CnH1-48 TaxID=2954494 RepID=UPI0020980C0E|nr:hypothetical protein [Pleionea sp. CnH1-48]MCO7226085.1 hypothetical protein [Pleionea sp. CnH1-48]
MNLIEQDFYGVEFFLLKYAENSADPLQEVIARSIAERLLPGFRVHVWMDNESANYLHRTGSRKTELSRVDNQRTVYCDKGAFLAGVDLSADTVDRFGHRYGWNKVGENNLPKSKFALAMTYSSRCPFPLLILVQHEDERGFDEQEQLLLEGVAHFRQGQKRLIHLVSTLRQNRLYGHISLRVYSFCRSQPPLLTSSQFDKLIELADSVSELDISYRRSSLASYLIAFVYNALSHQSRRSLERLKKEVGWHRLQAFVSAIEPSTDCSGLHKSKKHFQLNQSLLLMLSAFQQVATPLLKPESSPIFNDTQMDLLPVARILIASSRFLNSGPGKEQLLFWKNIEDIVLDPDSPTSLDFEKSLRGTLGYYIRHREGVEEECHERRQQTLYDRHITRLSFIQSLIQDVFKANVAMSDSQSQQLKQAVAYVLHETVRYYGMRETAFITRPLKFLRCLLNIVQFHAEIVLKIILPRPFLELTHHIYSRQYSKNRRQEVAFLQHVIDVYMTGFVLLDTQASHEDFSLAHYIARLSDSRECAAALNLKKGFAIAALMHDIALLKECPQAENDEGCEDLLRHSVIGEEERAYFGVLKSDKQHAMQSAHFSLQVLTQQNAYYQESSQFHISKQGVLVPAVRAILYHHLPPFSPGIGKLDTPILSLLSLVDELCVWEPGAQFESMPYRSMLTDKAFNLTPIDNYQYTPYQSVHLEKIGFFSNKSTQVFPVFHFVLSTDWNMHHKNCIAILRLAQAFGSLKNGESLNARWQPLAKVFASESRERAIRAGDKELLEKKGDDVYLSHILTTLDTAATRMNNEATHLIHSWLHHVREVGKSRDFLTLGKLKRPFQNLDIKEYFDDIERVILSEEDH